MNKLIIVKEKLKILLNCRDLAIKGCKMIKISKKMWTWIDKHKKTEHNEGRITNRRNNE